jgi:spore photoproduct lyase
MPNVLFELKTKTDRVDELIGLDHKGRTVVSWSLNTPPVIEREEHRCAPLDARLSAARRAVDAGYLVSFHFDPMVVHDGWQTRYPAVVERIFGTLPSERIAWISMGALRFPPSMLKTIEQRFPKSRLPVGELIHASDGKMRYIKPIRLALFRRLYAATRDAGGGEVFTYLCMEGPEIWRRVIGWAPESRHQVDYVFARSLARRFPYLIPTPRWADYDGAPSLGEIEPGRGTTTQNSTGRETPRSEASTPRRGTA